MARAKLVVLCGLIGSGKTTYALGNFARVTDLDMMHDFARKTDQIAWTKRMLASNKDVCHITCFPTDEELKAFGGISKEFSWISTSINQCKSNILIRNRPRDMMNIARVFAANEEYLKTKESSAIKFKEISVFGG